VGSHFLLQGIFPTQGLNPHLTFPALAAAAAKSLQSCMTLCNPIDSSPPGSPVPGIVQARTLEKEMATHSTILAWKIPWTEEPGGL